MSPIPNSDLPGHRTLHLRTIAAVELCQEGQEIEFKESAPWEQLKTAIAKTAMAMGNLRDGGVTIVGVSQRDGRWSVSGITADHLATFEPDEMRQFVNKYASPPVHLDIVTVQVNGNTLLSIQATTTNPGRPLICCRDGDGIAAGTIYVRPIGVAETRKPRTAGELDELLDRIAEYRAAQLLAQQRRISRLAGTDAQAQFDRELEGI